MRLRALRRVSQGDADRLRWLDDFGALIANTDRHQHNVVFFVDNGQVRLAPAFDQVSMFFAPSVDGQVPAREYPTPHATPDTLDVWDDARAAAQEFWSRVSDDARVSDVMRRVAAHRTRD